MPRTITLHPLSLLVGLGLALVGVVAMGQSLVPNRPATDHSSMYGMVAHPRDWVVIEQNAQYVVPQGRLLVITALGCDQNDNSVYYLQFDGTRVVTAYSAFADTGTTIKPIPVGLRATPGQVVDINGGSAGTGRAWGYLVDA